MPVRSLALHAGYQCAHSGACCRTPWDVPVEARAHQVMAAGLASGQVRPATDPFRRGPDLPAGVVAILRRGADGACTFLDADRLCAVHRGLGASALPATCRIFPRIALTDGRGTSITLSHYCPTAARLLLRTDLPLAIMDAPPAFPPADYEGLDATEAWPPTLRPGVLMGLDGHAAWEHHAVAVLAQAPSAVSALATLRRSVAQLMSWQPGGASLVEAIAACAVTDELPSASPAFTTPQPPARAWAQARYVAALATVPDALRDVSDDLPGDEGWRLAGEGWPRVDHGARAYVAAHAFANWTAYQGDGLRVWLASVAAPLGVLAVTAARHCHLANRPLDDDLFVEAIRQADLLLRHRASREALVAGWTAGSDAPNETGPV